MVANLFLVIFVGWNFFSKSKQENTTTVATHSSNITPTAKVVTPAIPVIPTPVTTEVVKEKIVEVPKAISPIILQPKTIPDSCIIYGPVNRDNKTVLELLLQKANILQETHIVSKPIYEIYWNFGNNKVNAFALFDKQKNGGPLQDAKFKLKQDQNNDWIVAIAEITADEKNAALTTSELAEKTNRVNAGGKWAYREKENVYFYQFNDSTMIPKDIKDVMIKTLSLPSAHCSN